MTSMICQSVAGTALARIHVGAAQQMGGAQEARFFFWGAVVGGQGVDFWSFWFVFRCFFTFFGSLAIFFRVLSSIFFHAFILCLVFGVLFLRILFFFGCSRLWICLIDAFSLFGCFFSVHGMLRVQ